MTRAEGTTTVAYTLRCDCGYPIHVEAGQAGLLVPCPSCQRQISAPRLTELRQLPSAKPPGPPRRGAARRFQYRLRHLLLLVFFWALFLSFGSCIGFELWMGLVFSVLLAVALTLGVGLCGRLLRKGMCAFWDFLEEHRHDEDKKP